jgi:hypothetical protein
MKSALLQHVSIISTSTTQLNEKTELKAKGYDKSTALTRLQELRSDAR